MVLGLGGVFGFGFGLVGTGAVLTFAGVFFKTSGFFSGLGFFTRVDFFSGISFLDTRDLSNDGVLVFLTTGAEIGFFCNGMGLSLGNLA